MSDQKIRRRQWYRRYKNFAIASFMLLSVWLGYRLAHIESSALVRKFDDQSVTIANLNQENHVLTKRFNKLNAKQLVCEAELTKVTTQRKTITKQFEACQQDVALFQHVMAPELSGGMLSVEITNVVAKSDENNVYTLDLVLLQPRLQKAVISGDLFIAVKYAHTNTRSELTSMPYRFKFFQQTSIDVKLAANSNPTQLIFYSDIYQYRRLRETYEDQKLWSSLTEDSQYK